MNEEDPAVKLYDRIQDLADAMQQARRIAEELKDGYARLDRTTLLVDDLGPAISGDEAVEGAIQGLRAVSTVLEAAADATADGLNTARKFGSRIYSDEG